jgi:hypothetical protein
MATMQAHLETGCESCKHLVIGFEYLARFGQREREYEPPESAMEVVKAYFNVSSLPRAKHANMQILHRYFDSFESPAIPGMRGLGSGPRRLGYRLDSLYIDVSIEQDPHSSCVTITGHVMDVAKTDGGVGEIPLSLPTEKGMARVSKTNRHGEFVLSFDRHPERGILINAKQQVLLLVLPEGPSEGPADARENLLRVAKETQ